MFNCSHLYDFVYTWGHVKIQLQWYCWCNSTGTGNDYYTNILKVYHRAFDSWYMFLFRFDIVTFIILVSGLFMLQGTLKEVQSRRYANSHTREKLHCHGSKFRHWLCNCWGPRFTVLNSRLNYFYFFFFLNWI